MSDGGLDTLISDVRRLIRKAVAQSKRLECMAAKLRDRLRGGRLQAERMRTARADAKLPEARPCKTT